MRYVTVYITTGETFEIEILESTTVIDICKILNENVFFHDDTTCVRCENVIAFELGD